MDFVKSFTRLQEIHTELQHNSLVDISQIMQLQEEAKKMYEYCNKQLHKVENDLANISPVVTDDVVDVAQ